jgi:hypothetical protein
MLTLDKEYKLRFGMGAMSQYEQLTGLKLADIDVDIPYDIVLKLLWVMLKQIEPDLTLEKTIELVDENADNLVEIVALTCHAFRSALVGSKKSPNAQALAAIKGLDT